MAAYLTQELEWGGCADTATNALDAELFANPALECASVEVPLDYGAPEGERAQIALTRLPARGEAEGSLLINPGGPGGAGTSFVASHLPQWQEGPVAERFDIVGFDPRGIGASTPALDCYTDEEYDAGDVPRFGAVYDITSAEQAADHAQRCIEGSGGVENLANAGSANVVRDMDVMREVLGDEQLTFLGYSYGSEIGAQYLAAHPDKVRAVVLDSAVGPDWTPSELRLAQFAASQARFDELAALCAESPGCVLGSDPAAANQRLHEIVAPLVEAPAATADGRHVSVWDVYLGITAGLAAEAHWPSLISALTELDAGRAEEILALRDGFYSRTADGVYATDIDTNIAVRCMDWPRLTAEEQTALAREVANVAPMFGIDVLTAGTYHSECEAWPASPTRDEPWLPADLEGLPEALVVSLTGDPATPYPGGVSMARTLGASLLTVEGKQHGAYLLGGSKCVDDAVNAYILDLETPPVDARCSL
ncbi:MULTISPECIES: alpha/beta hydrolase [Pseudonocardia]|uniref:Carboxylesterase A n=2 Tax=Pseudonocardia TaxID=1847 RepID=A0A1Y2MJ89_PSEAH|nr:MULTISPECIES: alpha/beta hydrolase [Pseudonocardia]OSY35232.1 Carboxylesterase A precursor [Pseudonocardia autotrophica]TDN73164.1 alpha/beta hydrolase family protein [Pseudonocardia autotrophica]BBG03890.1 protease [Pseudonocardia autotrophica]GEC28291.1 protease [Pseudonocardia saturnea]